MRLYSQKDVDKKALRGARIAVLGYGSQGRAHALNLKDSGFDVVVGVRKAGPSWKKAKKDGLEVAEPVAAARDADLVAMLVPDLAQKSLYESIESALKPGATLLFAHGFNIHFKQIKPRKDLDVVLIATEGTRRSGTPAIPTGSRRALPHRGRAGCDGQGKRQGARLCARHRRHARRRPRDDLRRGDRDRPLRRAGGAVRRRNGAGRQGLRDPGRGRLSARGRLLRVPARAEAHRRPAARGRPAQDARVHQRDGQVRRPDSRPARSSTTG